MNLAQLKQEAREEFDRKLMAGDLDVCYHEVGTEKVSPFLDTLIDKVVDLAEELAIDTCHYECDGDCHGPGAVKDAFRNFRGV